MSRDRQTLHATTVAFAGKAALLRGVPGSGKSDLALRLMEAGGELVADDQTALSRRGRELWATAPQPLKDLIEVRGLGIVRVPTLAEAQVTLLVDLVTSPEIERCPDPEREMVLGIELPRMRLHAPEASAVAKLRLALRLTTDSGARP
ncbi:MAG TPA: HPr kinase/phosphatase C-terminal domain-containing protein [Alphaproteobacteria bacterium]|nr:HPr kinase/phosphatase C-terminal domain-containing protein [Alphaproteobacteria bacterium]